MSRTPTTPFIPPLLSPHPSPQPQPSPVIPAYTPAGPPGHYPVYPATSPYTASPFIPPSPSEFQGALPQQSHSRQNSRQGVSADYTGYPLGGYPPQPTNTPLGPPLQPIHPMHGPVQGYPSPYTGYNSAPGAYGTFLQAGQTPWMAPQQMHSPYGPPPGRPPPGPGSYAGTPYSPYGAPLPPAAAPQWAVHTPHQPYFQPGPPPTDPNAWYGQPPPASAAPYGRAPPEPPAQVFDRMDPFTAGNFYGPVLEPMLIKIVKTPVRLNPLLSPLREDGPDRPYIKWDMSLASETAQRSDEPAHMSWQKGRAQPATFPRVTLLNIVSQFYPWVVVVKAKDLDCGVTCGEVIEAIGADMYRMSSKSDYDNLPHREKAELGNAYKYNRSPIPGVPGGRIGQGMRRLDFLRRFTIFGGIDDDDRVVTRVCGDVLPCMFVLRCAERYKTEKDIQELEARMRNTSLQQGPAPRSASRNAGTRSRASSVNTRISVHAPTSSTSYDTGTDSDSADYDR